MTLLLRRWSRFAVALVVCASTTGVRAAQVVPGSPPGTGLAIHFADGRTVYRPLLPTRGSSWTPLFPRIAEAATDREGLPLAALDIAHVMRGGNAIVTVTLLYGRPHERRVDVGTVTVQPGMPVRMDALRGFGVEPVTLSITSIPALVADAPVVTTVSPLIDATIEVLPGEKMTYLVVVVNRSPQAVRSFRIEGKRGNRKAISSARRGQRQTMLIPPGEGLMFELPATVVQGRSGASEVLPLSHLVIPSITWADGTVEGEQASAAYERGVDEGTARQLQHIVTAMREAAGAIGPQTPLDFRARVTALSIESESPALRLGMQQAKEIVLSDLDAVRARPSAQLSDFSMWLATTTREYDEWLARIHTLLGSKGR